MLIRIGQFDITECWDGVLHKKLSRYPRITDWEIQTVLDFIRYFVFSSSIKSGISVRFSSVNSSHFISSALKYIQNGIHPDRKSCPLQ